MEALTAVHVIREWCLPKLRGLAIQDDTARFNLLVIMFDEMAARVAQGGDTLGEDLHAFLYQDLPMRLAGHDTTIKRMQEGEEELLELLEVKHAREAEQEN